MGILANTVSLCQFRVEGELPSGDLAEWAAECLAQNAFRSIEQNADEQSLGWVQLDDNRDSDFSNPELCRRDHYLVFTLRRDQRKLPSALFKAWFERAQQEFLATRPELQRVPKAKREELREAVRGSLLARTLPVPASWDAVWDTRSGIVSFTSLSPKIVETFEALFKQTFKGARLVPVYPMARAAEVVAEALRPALQQANQASNDGVLEQIRDNQWLGFDLLRWLMYQSLEGDARFRVGRPGPALEGEEFVAYLNNRLILQGSGEDGVQKVAVTGAQDRFSEVCSALRSGKQLCEAVIHFEKGEHAWRFNLKGETFQFASFKAPAVTLEKDETVDAQSEKIAVFFERMHVLGEGLQLFDSLLASFLEERLGEQWPARDAAIQSWLDS